MTTFSIPKKKRNGQIVSVGVIAYTLVIGGVGLHKANTSPRTDDAEVFANYIGIAPQVDGPIVKLYVKDNQFVKKGQLLLEIDPRPYEYALQHAESEKDALEGQIGDQSRVIAAQTSAVAASRAGARSLLHRGVSVPEKRLYILYFSMTLKVRRRRPAQHLKIQTGIEFALDILKEIDFRLYAERLQNSVKIIVVIT